MANRVHMETSSSDSTPPMPTASSGPPTFVRAYPMGFAVAVVNMAERIGLVEYLNCHLRWDPQQCRVSPGIRLLALIVAMMVDPMALYRLPEWYEQLDVAVLFGPSRQAADFNDDAIGRALVKLFESRVQGTKVVDTWEVNLLTLPVWEVKLLTPPATSDTKLEVKLLTTARIWEVKLMTLQRGRRHGSGNEWFGRCGSCKVCVRGSASPRRRRLTAASFLADGVSRQRPYWI